ncbi:tRNA (adenine(22)-N(1))-methyltransferase [Streptococcus dentiloxodontae]
MSIPLSQRLLNVAQFVPKGAKLLDVGSDHAYLPLYLLEQNQIQSAIAGEVVKGPFESALRNVTQSDFSDRITVRLANGLAAFDDRDGISAITICGMGGRLIVDILDAGQEKLAKVSRLILQPNNCEDDLRLWLSQHQFVILDETIMTENGKYYEIIVAEHGKQELTSLDLRFGPCLRQEKSEVFSLRWQRELTKLELALTKVPLTNERDCSAISQKIIRIKEVLDNEGE